MECVHTLRLQSLRRHAEEALESDRRRLGDGALLAIKSGALALVAALLVAAHAHGPVACRILDQDAGVALRYPRGWHEGICTELVVQACELPCDVSACSIDAPRRGCCIAFWRLAWSDFAPLCRSAPVRQMVDGSLDGMQAAAAVADYIGLGDMYETVGVTRLDDRPAIMIRGRGRRGWTAAVVAPGPDLAFLLFHAPNRRALRAAWPAWTAIARAAQLIGNEPVTPVRQRPGSLVPLGEE
jgi:hypothetical protein